MYSEGTPDCQPQIGVSDEDEVSEIEECRVLTQVGEMPHSIPSPWPALASLFWFDLEDNNRSGALWSEVWHLSWSVSVLPFTGCVSVVWVSSSLN